MSVEVLVLEASGPKVLAGVRLVAQIERRLPDHLIPTRDHGCLITGADLAGGEHDAAQVRPAAGDGNSWHSG